MILDLIFAIFCLIFIWKRTGCKVYPSPQFILLAGYFLYYYLGLIVNHNEPYLNGADYFEDLVWFTRSGFLMIFIASLVTVNWRTLRFDYYFHKVNRPSKVDDIWLSKHLYALWLFMVVIVIFYLSIVPVQPILVMMNDPSLLLEARESVTVGLKNFGFFSNFFNEFIPITWMLLLLFGKRLAGISLMLLNLYVLLSTGQKSPILYILILFILTQGFMRGGFNYREGFRYGVVSLISLVFLVYYQNAHLLGDLNWEAIALSVGALVRRVFFIGPETVLGFLSTFPDAHPFLFGSNTDLPADKIVYQTIVGSTIDGTMNSNSLAFFYAWFGNKYIASFLYFIVVMLFLSTPAFLSVLAFPQKLAAVSFLGFNLLLIKFNITDWYTIYFIFLLAFLSVNGVLFVTRFLVSLKSPEILYRGNNLSVVVCVLVLLYFLQGQIRSFLN